MTAKFVTYRIPAIAASIAIFAGSAVAQPTLGFGTGTSAKSAAVTGVNFSINRVYDYDPETGVQLTSVPPRIELGSVFITRATDAASAAFIEAVANGETLGDVTVKFDNGDTWLLKNAAIMNYNSYSEEAGQQTENFDLSFDAAEMKIGSQTISLNKPAQ